MAGARTCAVHGLYLLTPRALETLDEAPLLGQVLDGKYALVGLLGGGGYGSVYRGLQQPLGREVAVKVLHGLALSLKLGRDRFEREALALSRLSSPHTVRLIDFGITQSGPIGVRNLRYMVIELIEGEDLERRLHRGSLHPDDLLDILDGVADSLAEAHAAGTIRRDPKPSNVILTCNHTGRVVPKVIDFGIARIEGASKSQTGFVTGTPAYMAPEQVRGEADLDARVDVYALAAMTFELLTGRPPYEGADPVAILTKHCVAPVPSLRDTVRAPGLWVLDDALASGLAKDRAARPPSPTTFVRELRLAWASRDRALPEVAPPRVVPISSAPVHALAPPTVPAPVAAARPAPEGEARPSSGTVAYGSPPSGDVPRPSTPGEAPAVEFDDGATAVQMPTPLTLSSLPAAQEAPAPAGRGVTRVFAIGGAAVGLVGLLTWGLVSNRASEAPNAPDAALGVAVAQPGPPVSVPASSPVRIVPTAAPESTAPVAVTPSAPASAPVTRPAPAPETRATPGPVRPAAAPVRRSDAEDHPSATPAQTDAQARRIAAALDAALDGCRCLPAQRLLEELQAAPLGGGFAGQRRARVAACRNVDVDHRCVNGRLVEVE